MKKIRKAIAKVFYPSIFREVEMFRNSMRYLSSASVKGFQSITKEYQGDFVFDQHQNTIRKTLAETERFINSDL